MRPDFVWFFTSFDFNIVEIYIEGAERGKFLLLDDFCLNSWDTSHPTATYILMSGTMKVSIFASINVFDIWHGQIELKNTKIKILH